MSFNDPSEGLVDELLDCLEMVDNGNQAGLRDRISDPAYYNNFVALAQNILPDGETVKTVGFTVRRSQGLRQVALRHTATEVREGFKPIVASNAQRISRGKERPVVVTGQLRFADSVHETNRIQVVPETGNAVTVYVPEGMMSDIVRPLWDEWVTIDGLKMGRTITLINIYKAV